MALKMGKNEFDVELYTNDDHIIAKMCKLLLKMKTEDV